MGAKDAHLDGNQQFGILGVQGTLGTADTKGTAETLPIGVHPDNGGMYVSPISLPPTAQTNPSLVLTYDGSSQLTGIALTIGANTYNKTITWVGGVATAVTVWSAA